ncbi:hypothetical protein D3C84_790350 [compost metagenome]
MHDQLQHMFLFAEAVQDRPQRCLAGEVERSQRNVPGIDRPLRVTRHDHLQRHRHVSVNPLVQLAVTLEIRRTQDGMAIHQPVQ